MSAITTIVTEDKSRTPMSLQGTEAHFKLVNKTRSFISKLDSKQTHTHTPSEKMVHNPKEYFINEDTQTTSVHMKKKFNITSNKENVL